MQRLCSDRLQKAPLSTGGVPDMLAARIYLKPLEGAIPPEAIPPWLGIAAQEFFLRGLGAAGSGLQDALHDEDGELRPFTASTVQPLARLRKAGWSPLDEQYFIRVTTLERSATEAFIRALSPGGGLYPGSRTEFHRQPFAVVRADFAATRDTGWQTYRALRASAAEAADRPIRLVFPCETAFSIDRPKGLAGPHLSLPLPLPSLIFGGLLRKWNRFCPDGEHIPEEDLAHLEALVAISEFDLRSGMVRFREEDKRNGADRGPLVRKGFKGEVEIQVYGREPALGRAVCALAAYAGYAGVGMATARGMGQCFWKQ